MSIKQPEFTTLTPLFLLSNYHIPASPSQLQNPPASCFISPPAKYPLPFLIVPYKTNPLGHFLSSPKNLFTVNPHSLQTHFTKKISSRIDPLQGVKTASKLVFLVSKLFHFLNQTGHHDQIH